MACGTLKDIIESPESITGDFLSGRREITVPKERRRGNGKFISVYGAKQNNLKNINVDFPQEKITVVTGVSGSGKSSLIHGILYP